MVPRKPLPSISLFFFLGTVTLLGAHRLLEAQSEEKENPVNSPLLEDEAPTKTETPLDRFQAKHPFRNPELWGFFDVSKSVVTETRRRIYFEKAAVTRALLQHRGGSGRQAAPMSYEDGTVFVAEALDKNGVRLDTEVLITRRESSPEFLLFDSSGAPSDTFPQPNDPPDGPRPGNVPSVCVQCHEGTDFFDPMMSFPDEPESRTVVLPDRERNSRIVERFLEGFHRGDTLFSPFGAIWLSRLKADALAGSLNNCDTTHYDSLREWFPDLLPRRRSR